MLSAGVEESTAALNSTEFAMPRKNTLDEKGNHPLRSSKRSKVSPTRFRAGHENTVQKADATPKRAAAAPALRPKALNKGPRRIIMGIGSVLLLFFVLGNWFLGRDE